MIMKLRSKWREISLRENTNNQIAFLKDSLKLYNSSPRAYAPFLLAGFVVSFSLYLNNSLLLSRVIGLALLSFYIGVLFNYYNLLGRYIRKWEK